MPLVNGREYQHATIRMQAKGPVGAPFEFTKFRATSYKGRAEKQPTKDSRGKIDGYTIMPSENEGSIRTRFSEWQAFKRWAAQNFPELGIGEIEFDFSITYGNSLAKLVTEKLSMVMIQEDPRSSEDNQEMLEVEIPLFVGSIEDNNGKGFVNYDRVQDV